MVGKNRPAQWCGHSNEGNGRRSWLALVTPLHYLEVRITQQIRNFVAYIQIRQQIRHIFSKLLVNIDLLKK
jgi:hypothetical protein